MQNPDTEKIRLLNIIDPRRLDSSYASKTVAQLKKIIEDRELDKRPTFNSPEPIIRKPDKAYRDQLIPDEYLLKFDSPKFRKKNVNFSEEDEAFKIAVEESLKSFELEQKYNIDIEAEEINKLVTKEKINIDKLSDDLTFKPPKIVLKDVPEGLDPKICFDIYGKLQNLDFIEAKKLIAEIQDLKHMEWIKSLTYNNKPLKILIKDKDPLAYKVFEI